MERVRGVGRSQGIWDGGPGELSDAASALDWLQIVKPDSNNCWIAGVSFGTWIAMQLLMRRPEVEGFICVAPPSNLYDFSFLAPCPSSGLMINGEKDRVVPTNSVADLTQRLKTQRGIKITHQIIPGATLLGYANADHWSIVLPLEDSRASDTVQMPKRFPR